MVGTFPGDPGYACAAGDEFSGCDESWSTIITESENIIIAGAGFYSWFSTYSQACIDSQTCQKALIRLDSNFDNVRIMNLVTIGAKYMAVMDGRTIAAADNLNVKTHPSWSQVTVLDVIGNGTSSKNLVWIDPAIWEMAQPLFTCSAPCYVQLPPWTSATSTVDYPLMTVGNGAWTSTITHAPLTISEWVFEPITITAGGGIGNGDGNGLGKRQGFGPVVPVLATTPSWPSIIYNGPDGAGTTTAPSGPFPTPPPSVGQRDAFVMEGPETGPSVMACFFFGLVCIKPSWLAEDDGTLPNPGAGGADYNENWEELQSTCPIGTSTTSSTSLTAPTPTPPVRSAQPSPRANQVDCYGWPGGRTEHSRMDAAAHDFCVAVQSDEFKDGYSREETYKFNANGGWGSIEIVVALDIKPSCEWLYTYSECRKYLAVPEDGCDCDGADHKYGGVVENNCLTARIDPNIY